MLTSYRFNVYINMISKYLNFLCLLALCSSVKINTLTREGLDNLKRFPDYTNHFIFFNQKTIDEMDSYLQKWDNQGGTVENRQTFGFI